MAEDRGLTIHFVDGTKASFTFQRQVTLDEFISLHQHRAEITGLRVQRCHRRCLKHAPRGNRASDQKVAFQTT